MKRNNWKELIELYNTRTGTKEEFCHQHEIKAVTLNYHLKKSKSSAPSKSFVPLELFSRNNNRVSLEILGGIKLTIDVSSYRGPATQGTTVTDKGRITNNDAIVDFSDGSDVCIIEGSTYSAATNNYAQKCSLPRKDCDLISGIWYCASENITNSILPR